MRRRLRNRYGRSRRIGEVARVVGLRDVESASLEAIDRRRLELWVLTTVVVASVGLGMFLVTGDADLRLPFPSSALRGSIVALALAFCAYAVEKEFHLRKLARLLVDERLLTQSLSTRVSELSEVLQASRAMNSVLDVEQVLEVILSSAVDILDADSGSVMLAEDEQLRTISALGNRQAEDVRVPFGEGIAGHVAVSREPVLISGRTSAQQFPGSPDRERDVRSAISVPLINRDELLGVLNVNARAEADFGQHDLRALSVFGEQAATAIANARLYQLEQERVAQLEEVDRMKREFITAINHDLRTPLTILLGGATIARRQGISAEERDRFLGAIERQANQLAGMIDALLVAAELDRDPEAGALGSCDAAEVARTFAADLESLERAVVCEAPASCPVVGAEATVRRIISNLVDNAFKHGAPPVSLRVVPAGDRVEIVVRDAGGGIPTEHHDRVFDRFFRIDPNRTRPGMGLGLSIVRSLVVACRGEIEIAQPEDGGTEIRVTLERRPELQSVDAEATQAAADPRHAGT